MIVDVIEPKKRVEIWLTRSERNDSEVRTLLEPLYAEYAAKKYRVVIFRSGAGDLLNNTESLILNNRAL